MHSASRHGRNAGVRLRQAGRATLALTLLVGTAAGLNIAFGANAAAQDDRGELVERGSDLFGNECATCHGAAGRGSQDGPDITDQGAAAADFVIRTGRMPLETPDEPVRHREPRVSDAEREALVAYVATLGDGPPIPEIEGYEDADLSRGHAIFTENCAACHGPTAQGIAVGQDDISSTLDEATPLEIAESIRVGPGVMPVFDDRALGEEDLEATVAWILQLRERENPGGIAVGRSGPVSEGMIAWVLGMGLLGIVMYLLGDKASDEDEGPGSGDETAEPAAGGDDGRS